VEKRSWRLQDESVNIDFTHNEWRAREKKLTSKKGDCCRERNDVNFAIDGGEKRKLSLTFGFTWAARNFPNASSRSDRE
jgi:hypothetical protein